MAGLWCKITIHQININQTGLNRAAIMRQLKLFYWPKEESLRVQEHSPLVRFFMWREYIVS